MSGLAYTSGHIIGERYRLLSRLGAGGMGEVWRAEHVTLKSPVAIKFINPGLAASGDALQRFMREAQSSAALRSTHIVQVFDFGVDDRVPYIAMELLHGESLGERLQRESVLSPAATGTILMHVARAMAQAHEAGVVHRDLKPDNVFIVSEQHTEIAKVLDFGVAKVTGGGLEATTGGGTKTGAILGTPFYVSPEQARGNKTVDFRSDLWALGVITYECLTGSRPFDSDGLGDLLMKICGDPHPPPSAVARVPLGFDEWTAKALHKEPEQRFASALQMAEAFQALLSQGSQTTAAPNLELRASTSGGTLSGTPQGLAVTTAPSQTRRRPWVWLAVAAGLGSVAAAGGAAIWAFGGASAPAPSGSALASPGETPEPGEAPEPAETAAPEPEKPVEPSPAVAAPSPASSASATKPIPESATATRQQKPAAAPKSKPAPPPTPTVKEVPAPPATAAPAPARAPATPTSQSSPKKSSDDLFGERF